eukprot:230955-Chlamydomonas_euryale.AAC.8
MPATHNALGNCWIAAHPSTNPASSPDCAAQNAASCAETCATAADHHVELLPPRDRPKTSTAVARRFLSHALGMPGLRDKSAEQQLAQLRQVKKDERREKDRARAEAWD